MNKKTKQTNKSGNNSKTLQVENLTIYKGAPYSEIKEIVLDIFDSNFLKLSKESSKTAKKRAEEITNDFLSKLKIKNPNLIEVAKDPGFQITFFEAQKSYAKTGDKDMASLLVDILIDRAEHKERDLRQIVLEESINIIPKLTSSQLDTLTIIFLLKNSINNKVNDFDSLKQYLNSNIKPFSCNLSKEISLYLHLQFTGCAAVSMGSTGIVNIFKGTYRGLFFKGFDEKDFSQQVGEIDKYKNIIIKCFNNKEKFQLKAMNKEDLDKKLSENKFDNESIKKIKKLFDQYILSNEEIEKKLLGIGDGFMNNLFEIWKNSSIGNTFLTSVGIAIAQANYRNKVGQTLELSFWIK